jgi:diguanylate cyclase (GGDEF)-like protein
MQSKLVQRGIVAALVLAALIGAVAVHLVTKANVDQERTDRIDAATARVQTAIGDRAFYLEDIADMVGVHDDADAEEFSRYAEVRRGGDQTVVAVEWLRRSPDGELVPPHDIGADVVLVHPSDHADAKLADPAGQRIVRSAVESATDSKQVGLSKPVELANGHQGFYLAAPVEAHRFSGAVSQTESRSAMVGLIDAQELVAGAADADTGPLELSDSGDPIARAGTAPTDTVNATLPAPAEGWSVSVDAGGLTAFERGLPWITLIVGLGLAGAVAVILRSTSERRDDAERLARDRALELERRSREDPLTGVYNRRHFSELLAAELRDSDVASGPAVMLIDLDHFKQVNDDHGHLTGDVALQAAVRRIARVLRGSDCLARWGGEEFAVLVPEITREEIGVLAERVRHAVSDRPIAVDAIQIDLTLSAGIALAGEGLRTPDTLVHAADQALYEAKRAGRNRVRVWGPAAKPEPLVPISTNGR